MEDLERFYHFWAWEYVSRNKFFIEDCHRLFKHGEEILKKFAHLTEKYEGKTGPSVFGTDPADYDVNAYPGGLSKIKAVHVELSQTIVKSDMDDPNLLISYDHFEDTEKEFISEFDDFEIEHRMAFNKWGYYPNLIRSKTNSSELIRMISDRDTNMPINIRRISNKYGERPVKYYESFGRIELDLDYPISFLVNILKDAKRNHETKKGETNKEFLKSNFAFLPLNKPGVGLERASDNSRAVGLWLWDRVQELEGARGAIRQSIRELEDSRYLVKLGLEPGDEDLRFFRSKTDDCIQAAEVFPFTKRKKGTKNEK